MTVYIVMYSTYEDSCAHKIFKTKSGAEAYISKVSSDGSISCYTIEEYELED